MKFSTPVIVSMAAMVIAVIAGVVIMAQGISDNARLLVINAMMINVFQLIATAVVGSKASQASTKVDEIAEDLRNGLIPQKVVEGLQQATNVEVTTVDNKTDKT